MQSTPLDLQKIRAQFPAFSTSELKDKVFADNAAGSYTSKQVLDRLDHFYRVHKVQPYGAYPASIDAGEMMDDSFQLIADALNLPNDWVHFGPSTSTNSYVLGNAFAQYLKSGDRIIVTDQDHEANSGAWRKLAKMGVEILEWKIDPSTGLLDTEALQPLLDMAPKLLAFPHCSNIVGAINDAKTICAMAHEAGALAIVDGVSYAPHGLPNLGDIDPDIYFFSAYKTFGPHQGVMAIRPELARDLPNQAHFFNDEKLRYRLTPSGPDHAQIGAMGGVAQYLQEVAKIAQPNDSTSDSAGATPYMQAHEAMRAQEIEVMKPLIAFLTDRNDVRLIGPHKAKDRAPTISILHERPAAALASTLAAHDILTAGGHFYAYRTLQSLGIDPNHGVLRLSLAHYTSPDDVTRTIEALQKVL